MLREAALPYPVNTYLMKVLPSSPSAAAAAAVPNLSLKGHGRLDFSHRDAIREVARMSREGPRVGAITVALVAMTSRTVNLVSHIRLRSGDAAERQHAKLAREQQDNRPTPQSSHASFLYPLGNSGGRYLDDLRYSSTARASSAGKLAWVRMCIRIIVHSLDENSAAVRAL